MAMHHVREAELRRAGTAGEYAAARALFAEYVASLPGVAASFEHQNVEREFAGLPGAYGPPGGMIVLAWSGAEAVGCAGIRPLPQSPSPGDPEPICELKRMFVKPSARGTGLGRRLAEYCVREAGAMGYAMMKLDTEPQLVAATALYRSLGLVDIARYNDDPCPETMYLGLRLRP
jgi:GNAT superfamily N-acetyltransferase